MGPAELGYYIAKKLDEAKHNLISKIKINNCNVMIVVHHASLYVFISVNSIELIGKEAVIALFLKTTKIERLGGLMVMVRIMAIRI